MTLKPLKETKTFDDGAFVVGIGPYGLFHARRTRNGEEEALITSPTLEEAAYWARAWLKAEIDGEWPASQQRVLNKGVVGGKL